MAKKLADTTRMSFEIELKTEHIPILAALMDVPDGVTMSDLQKIRDMAEATLTHLATGGVIYPPEDVKMIEGSTGITLGPAEDLIPYLTEETGMQDGMHRVIVLIDPANYPAYEELARTQETTVDHLMQEVVDMVQANEWVYELHPRPRQVLMTEADAEELQEILGEKFATGSDLARLIKAKLAPAEEEDLFASSNVGAEE